MLDNDTRIVNSKLPSTIDAQWESNILESLTLKDASTIGKEMGHRVLAAIERNTILGTEIRKMLIDKVQLIDRDSAQDLYASLNRTDMSFQEATDRSGLIAISDHNQVIYPAFQFEHGQESFAILQAVQSQFTEVKNGWSVLSWWTSENAQLGWDIPKDVYETNPARLIRTLWKQEIGY